MDTETVLETKPLTGGFAFTSYESLIYWFTMFTIGSGFLEFGYFALGVTSDPLNCMATETSNEIWKSGDTNGFIQVGAPMRQAFVWAFVMSCI